MKKLILFAMMTLAAVSCHAITLFPHFVDVAGDYEDGTAIIKYTASLADGIFGHDATNEGKWSVIYLVQTPDEPLYVGISEDN